MADDQKAVPETKDAAEGNKGAIGIDAEALNKMIRDGVSQGMDKVMQDAQSAQQRREAEAAQRAAQERANADPVTQTVRPVVQPALDALNLKAENALDQGRFYLLNPEAVEYAAEIEALHQQWISRGIAVTRDDAFKYWKGANVDRYTADRQAKKQEDERRVWSAGTATGSRGTPPQPFVGDPNDMSEDQLAEYLKNANF